MISDAFGKAECFVLGRRTYGIFAASWPNFPDKDDPVASRLNTLPKYVVSTTLENADWQPTTIIRGDIPAEVASSRTSTKGRSKSRVAVPVLAEASAHFAGLSGLSFSRYFGHHYSGERWYFSDLLRSWRECAGSAVVPSRASRVVCTPGRRGPGRTMLLTRCVRTDDSPRSVQPRPGPGDG